MNEVRAKGGWRSHLLTALNKELRMTASPGRGEGLNELDTRVAAPAAIIAAEIIPDNLAQLKKNSYLRRFLAMSKQVGRVLKLYHSGVVLKIVQISAAADWYL
ncbi:hypothetical protein Pmani_039688 [Petrolisthes manimaculis]|uniref:Uncharacterized protein n=1 Tax=Petrolisthes manimaculis TaxID=1843537 RepID=A0AAE1NEN9_9EUCA|nr:hypothetical protein Pmani_039688 [Petrolisthes manimaculis]